MAFANNRAAAKPRASFQTAGGTIIKYRNPVLAYQIAGSVEIDEINVSQSLRLNETFLNAQPLNDHSIIEPLVDGSTITITNHSMAGTMTLQVLRGTGLVGDGDFVAAAHLVIASKDSIGGTLTVIENTGEKRLITIFYGVTFKNVPHMIKAGNALVTYPMVLNYSGWVQGVSAGSFSEKTIWAVGNKLGLKGVYKPYAIQKQEAADFWKGNPVEGLGVNGVDTGEGDSNTAENAGVAESAADRAARGASPEYLNDNNGVTTIAEHDHEWPAADAGE